MLEVSLEKILHTTKAHLSKLQKLGISSVRDLIEYFPRTVESTVISSDFQNLVLGVKNTLAGSLYDVRKEKTPRGKIIGRGALVLDDGVTVEVVWYQIPYLLKNLKEGARVFLVGKLTRDYGRLTIQNPEIHLDQNIHVGVLRAVYPESPPITSKWLREKISGLSLFFKEFEEVLPSQILAQEKFMPRAEALRAIHMPQSFEEWQEAKRRLGFEEIFEIQVRVMREKFLREKISHNVCRVPFNVDQIKEDLQRLPFSLTLAQKRCLHLILKDFEGSRPMHRLMQGDVGSGKTIVAFLASLQIVRAGHQVAILAPTEILARQHFQSALQFFPQEFRVELLTGSVTSSQKRKIKSYLRSGDIHILIGTHALFTEDTIFRSLGFAVIDEQHRFGVEQRAILAQNNTHVLAMTATPIPRTLALTIYGDQDLCQIDELPPGRKPVITRIIADSKTQELCYRFIDDQILKHHQIFWICPLIDESDKIEAKNVLAEFQKISQEIFPSRRVEFLHGKLKTAEKDAIMSRFRNHEFDILVSTSVIEVGVDIPNATVMVIENSERFGLAQLHQFRGRIGRNDLQSYCFLMVGKPDDKNKTRLREMEKSQNGLYLAEIDLKLRGMGDLYGTKQSGIPDFKCADISNVSLLQNARDWAIKVLQEDLSLEKFPALRKRIEEKTVYF